MGVFHFFLLLFMSFVVLFSVNIQWGDSEVLYVQAYNMTDAEKEQSLPTSIIPKDLKVSVVKNIEMKNEKDEVVENQVETQQENQLTLVIASEVIPEVISEVVPEVTPEETLAEVNRIKKILYNNTEYLKNNGSRSFRNNNPGNLRYTGQQGSVGKDGNGFAIFPSYELGKQAHIRQIQLDAQRGYTIADFISKFAPKEENFSEDYTAFLLRRFPEFHPETSLNDINELELQEYMQRMEGWIEPDNNQIQPMKEVPILSMHEKKQILQKRKCKEIQDIKDRMNCMRSS
jgi:hypothetical protein